MVPKNQVLERFDMDGVFADGGLAASDRRKRRPPAVQRDDSEPGSLSAFASFFGIEAGARKTCQPTAARIAVVFPTPGFPVSSNLILG